MTKEESAKRYTLTARTEFGTVRKDIKIAYEAGWDARDEEVKNLHRIINDLRDEIGNIWRNKIK